MATYKVIQDVEAEDKLVGPLTLRQFIYAGIAALSGYLGFLSAAKGAPFMLGVFIPITLICGFFAFPWGRDQPTEIWALAKIRFMLKPRRRIWDQSGTKDLVSVTAPKVIEKVRTNGLNLDEVHSRLQALADTIDSRGWAIKNVNVNLATAAASTGTDYSSDRLVQASNFPQEVSNIDVSAADDMLDASANPVAQHFDTMITAAGTAYRQQLIAKMQQPSIPPPPAPQQPQPFTPQPPVIPQPPQQPRQQQPVQQPVQAAQQTSADYWFLQGQTPTVNTPGQATFTNDPVVTPGQSAQTSQGLPTAATPTAEEEALVEKLRTENSSSGMTAAYGHMKTLKTPEQLAAEAQAAAKAAPAKPPVTPDDQAAIINLANNDDLDVATIARQAHEQVSNDSGEVVISLH
jgi:hypothetical protein